MSTRSGEGSRPERKETSTRNTARDVPAAKYREGSIGTVAPRGLRGPSLLPGQGAPERINPEDVELAVLRDAETLDGPHIARVAQKRLPDPRSPSPTPVSVEVPRARSIPPALTDNPSTPPSPSARSIQSGTLMSIGSVDPRAPTELSLPSPRPLSVSERAVYLGPAAVVDRTPSVLPRELPGALKSSRPKIGSPRPPAPPPPEPLPDSSPRSVPVGSGAISSARPSLKAESVAPPAQRVMRPPRPNSSAPPRPGPSVPPRPTPRVPAASVPPRPTPNVALRPTPVVPPLSYSPATPAPASVRDPHSVVPSSRRSAPASAADVPPQFRIHADLDAVRAELREDNFDLRSAHTQREPLASRKQLPSADWTPHGTPSEGAFLESESSARSKRYGALAAFQTEHDTAPPTTGRLAFPEPPASRASVPVSWVLAAAAFAVLLALIVAWVMRPPVAQEAARPVDGRGHETPSAAAPSPVLLPTTDQPLPRSAPRGRGVDSRVPATQSGANANAPSSHPRLAAPKGSSAGVDHAQSGVADQPATPSLNAPSSTDATPKKSIY